MTALVHMTDDDLKNMGIPMVNSYQSCMVFVFQFFLWQYFSFQSSTFSSHSSFLFLISREGN